MPQDHCRRRWWFLEIELQHAESFHTLVLIRIPEYSAIPGRTMIGPVIKVHFQFLGTLGIEIQIPSTRQRQIAPSDMQKEGSRRGWVASQRSWTQSHEFWITFEKIHCKRKWTLFYRDGAIPHRGNSCDAVRNSHEFSVLFKRSCSCWRREVEWHSCLQVFQRRLSSSRNLKIGHESGTSLWSRWTRNWRRCSLEFCGSETAEGISEVRRAKILGHWLVSTHLWRKQQDEVPVLQEFQEFPTENPCHSRTHWWESDGAWVDGSCRYSVQMEMFFSCYFDPQIRTNRWRTRKVKKEDRPSSSHLSTRSGTVQSKKNQAMLCQNRETYTITVSGQIPRTPSIGSSYPEHKTKNCGSGRQGLMP